MARPPRIEYPGAVWHVTSRGNDGMRIFRSDRDRRLFLSQLEETIRRHRWILHDYCLMDNHIHLIVETPIPNLSRGMQKLLSRHAQGFNRRHHRKGHLFGERFKGQLIEKGDYLMNALRYLALNPVRAGLVTRPEDYRWSSYRAKGGLEEAPSWLAIEWTLGQLHAERSEAQRIYRQWVTARLAEADEDPFRDAVGQIYLGSKQWIAEMRIRIESGLRSDDHPRATMVIGRPEMAEVVTAVASAFQIPRESLQSRGRSDPRMLAAWLGCYEGLLRLRQIAAGLRLRSTGRVSDLIRLADRALDRNPLLRIALDRCCDLLRGSPPPSLPPPSLSVLAVPLRF